MTCTCEKPNPGMTMNGRTMCKTCGGEIKKDSVREALMEKMQGTS